MDDFDFFGDGSIGGPAIALQADNSWNTPRTPLTVTGDAISSMQPVDFNPNSGWGGFFANMTKSLAGYAVSKDLAQTNANVVVRTNAAMTQQQLLAAQAAAQPRAVNPTLLLIVAGVVVVVLMRKG